MSSNDDILGWAKEVIDEEAKEVAKPGQRLDDSFVKAIKIMNDCKGKVVASGMGKAGIIASKFSATISSTGTPSLFYIRLRLFMVIWGE